MFLLEVFRNLILVAPSPVIFSMISTALTSVFADCRPYRLLDVQSSAPKLLNAENVRSDKNNGLDAILGSPS